MGHKKYYSAETLVKELEKAVKSTLLLTNPDVSVAILSAQLKIDPTEPDGANIRFTIHAQAIPRASKEKVPD